MSMQEKSSLCSDRGLGGKVFLTPPISIRPEIRVFGSWDHSFIRDSGGIGYTTGSDCNPSVQNPQKDK